MNSKSDQSLQAASFFLSTGLLLPKLGIGLWLVAATTPQSTNSPRMGGHP